MKKPMLQERTIQDAIAFWQQLRHGQFRPLFAEPTENTVTQLFRYVLTGASSFLVDFLLLFLLEMLGVHYLPAAACSFAVGITCNFLLTKYFAFKSVDSSVGPAAEIAVFIAISVVGLLVTMGTTKKQLYRIVFRQTGKATVIGCAIGAAAGLVITFVILPGVLSDMYLHGLGSASAMISFNPYVLILSLASGALAGFLSSALAIRKLAGISPVQSVKYTEKVHSHTTRSTGAGRFDIINMSWKNIFRFRGRFWLTVISVTLGVGISVTAFAVSHGIDTTNQISYEHHDFQIMSMIDTLTMDQYSKEYRFFPEDMAERMTKISGVEKVIKTTGGYGSISKKSKPFELRFSDKDNGKSNFVVQ